MNITEKEQALLEQLQNKFEEVKCFKSKKQ